MPRSKVRRPVPRQTSTPCDPNERTVMVGRIAPHSRTVLLRVDEDEARDAVRAISRLLPRLTFHQPVSDAELFIRNLGAALQ